MGEVDEVGQWVSGCVCVGGMGVWVRWVRWVGEWMCGRVCVCVWVGGCVGEVGEVGG